MELLLFEVIVTESGVPKTVLRTLVSTVLFTETQIPKCTVLVGTLVTSTDMLVCLLSRHLLEIERFGWAEHFHSTRQ